LWEILKRKSYAVKTSGQYQDYAQLEHKGGCFEHSTTDKLCHVFGGHGRFHSNAGRGGVALGRGKPQLVEREQRQVRLMNVIIDANIVFSAILNVDGQISDLLLNSSMFTFVAPDFLRHEIHSHHDKLMKLSRLPLSSIQEAEYHVCRAITFVSETTISRVNWQFAVDLASDIDEKDIVYVAFAKQFNGHLWTGDKRLIRGLLSKDFRGVIATDSLSALRERLK
jgi:predicted nucleic acid-binding protein